MGDSQPDAYEVAFLYFRYLWQKDGDIRRSRLVKEVWGIDYAGIMCGEEAAALALSLAAGAAHPDWAFRQKIYNWLKARFGSECLCFKTDMRREAGNMAAQLNIPFNRVAACHKQILIDLAEEYLKPKA